MGGGAGLAAAGSPAGQHGSRRHKACIANIQQRSAQRLAASLWQHDQWTGGSTNKTSRPTTCLSHEGARQGHRHDDGDHPAGSKLEEEHAVEALAAAQKAHASDGAHGGGGGAAGEGAEVVRRRLSPQGGGDGGGATGLIRQHEAAWHGGKGPCVALTTWAGRSGTPG